MRSWPTVHPLAFVEFVTNTLIFYGHVLADISITPEILRIEIQLDNLAVGKGTALPAGGINNLGWSFGEKYAPGPSCTREIAVDGASYDATLAAFRLLREVCVWFGHTEEEIPYTTGAGDDRRIDTSAIVAIG